MTTRTIGVAYQSGHGATWRHLCQSQSGELATHAMADVHQAQNDVRVGGWEKKMERRDTRDRLSMSVRLLSWYQSQMVLQEFSAWMGSLPLSPPGTIRNSARKLGIQKEPHLCKIATT